MTEIQIIYVNTKDEKTTANLAFSSDYRQRNCVFGLGIICLTISLVMVFIFHRHFSDWNLLFILGFSWVLFPLLLRSDIKNKIKKQHTLDKDEEVSIKVSDVEIEISKKEDYSRFSWGKIIKIREGKKGFLLYTHPQSAEWIPMHSFQNDSDRKMFVDLARAKVLKYIQK